MTIPVPGQIPAGPWVAQGLERAFSQVGETLPSVKTLFLRAVSKVLEEDIKENRPLLSTFEQAERVFFDLPLGYAEESGPDLPVYMPEELQGKVFVYVRFLLVGFKPSLD